MTRKLARQTGFERRNSLTLTDCRYVSDDGLQSPQSTQSYLELGDSSRMRGLVRHVLPFRFSIPAIR